MADPALPVSPEAPIGVFDSGIGGLSVLRHVQALLPSEELLYFADSGFAPYGEKPEHVIVEIAYSNPVLAARHRWYPGMEHIGNRTVRFETNHYFDVLRMLNYVT